MRKCESVSVWLQKWIERRRNHLQFFRVPNERQLHWTRISCAEVSSSNDWINEALTLLYLKRVIGSFSFQKRLLARDNFQAHMTEPVKKSLNEMRISNALILDGGTKYIQAPDVFYNKPFKTCVMEFYDEWLASGVHYYIETGYWSLHQAILFKPGALTSECPSLLKDQVNI